MARVPDPAELLQLATGIATEAAQLVARRRAAGVAVAATKSSPTDVVTAADRESEQLIRARLRSARPHDAVLGEEEGRADGDSGVLWLVDPIDGSVNYLYQIPSYGVSIAARVGGQVVAGVVVNAATLETWTAYRGGGAYLACQRLHVNDVGELSAALVGTGFGYRSAKRAWQARVLAGVLPRVRDIRRVGAAAVDLCYVADGRLDAFYESGLNPWDLGAGLLIVEEAGGRVGGLPGAPAGGELAVAAGPRLFDALQRLLAAQLAALPAAPTS